MSSKLQAKVFVGECQNFEGFPGTFSPTTSTLILGERDAVLVDAQHIKSDVANLGDLIAETGRRLTTIYITHGHADHFYGIGELARRFPGVRSLTTAGVSEFIEKDKESALRDWAAMFGDRVANPDVFPTVTAGPLDLEGHELRIVEVGQGDIENCTVLHVPEIDLVVPGDVVYNKIHMMLGLSGPAEWALWIDSLDQIAALKPKMIVAGHKKPEAPDTEVARMLHESRSYIEAFAAAAKRCDSAESLITAMIEKFPDFGNPWTLEFSAGQYFERLRA